MPRCRYVYYKKPPTRKDMQIYSPVEQLVYDQIIGNYPSAHCVQFDKNDPFSPSDNVGTQVYRKENLEKRVKTEDEEFLHPADVAATASVVARYSNSKRTQKLESAEMYHKVSCRKRKAVNASLNSTFIGSNDEDDHAQLQPDGEYLVKTQKLSKDIQRSYSALSDFDQASNTQLVQSKSKYPSEARKSTSTPINSPVSLDFSAHLNQKTSRTSTPIPASYRSTPTYKTKPSIPARTPTSCGKKRKNPPTTPTMQEAGTLKHDTFIVDNHRRLIDQIKKCQRIVMVTSMDQHTGDWRSTNCVSTIQISLTLEPGANRWESFMLTLSERTGQKALDCYRQVMLECFRRGQLVCNDAKSTLGQLTAARILSPEDLRGIRFHDVLIASWLLNSDEFERSSVTYSHLPNETVAQNQLASKMCDTFSELQKSLNQQEMWKVYTLEISIISILVTMESKGLSVDMKEFASLDRVMLAEIKALEKRSQEVVGSPVVLNSTAQLRQVLYDRLQLDKKLPKTTQYKTAKNQETSTSEGMLNQLVPYHPLPKIILNYRQIYKIHSTYIAGMRGHISKDNVVRPYWDQTAASTGRLQCARPNIQSVPKTSISWINDVGESVGVCPRSIYNAREGYTFLSVDFKQIEFRIFAHMTADTQLIEVLKDDKQDVFENLTAVWLNRKLDDVSDAERERTKRIVYSVMYGVGKYRLSQQLNITPLEAQSIMSRFLKQFPGIHKLSNNTITLCKKDGYAVSMLGRRRVLPNINHKGFKERSHAERQAVNFTIQGSAADICKLVMRENSSELRLNSIDASLLVQIHDELLYEVLDSHLSQARDIINRCMESNGGKWYDGIHLNVPLRIAMKIGKKWANMKDSDAS